MARPYRRRKGKNGPLVGNYRVTVNGRDFNLGTKDATEASARARLAAKGKWPPTEAAVDAAVTALDPAREKTIDPEPPPHAETVGEGGALPQAAPPARPNSAPPAGTAAAPEQLEREPLEQAAAAAAAEAAGETAEPKSQRAAEAENHVNEQMKSLMTELAGEGGIEGDLLGGICDGAAGLLLFVEGKAIEWGVNWTLAKRKSTRRLVTKQPEAGSISRKALRIGLQATALEYFPNFASSLTPPIAIAIGMVGGAIASVTEGQLIDVKSGEAVGVAAAVHQAREEAKAAAAASVDSSPQPST